MILLGFLYLDLLCFVCYLSPLFSFEFAMSSTTPSLSTVPSVITAPPGTLTAAGPSALTVGSAPVRSSVTIPVVFEFSMAAPSLSFDPRSSAVFQAPFTLFESVHLESAEFTLWIYPGSGRRVQYAVSGSASAPANFLAAPLGGVFAGAAYNTTTNEVVLPPEHSFGRELKAVNVGNPSPCFHFVYAGGTAAATSVDVALRGNIRVSFSGFGIVPAISL